MRLSLIAAMDKNRLIGVNGRIPWHLPDDMKWFREQTMGKPVIMGRKTFESIPIRFRPLPGRHNIVLTRRHDFEAEGVTAVHSVEAALTAAGDVAEVVVIGGAELYAQLLPQADRLFLTLIDAEFEGDAYFPGFDPAQWRETYRQERPADERHDYPFTWLILERLK
ncbi:MAG: type 3 dihydrofolate reductase [Ardenticatenaceae bacterium]|nr:type 3 dihydrofolate reductase [Ardenticatenaceae bacterium]